MKAVKFYQLLLIAMFAGLFCACDHKPLYVLDTPEDDPTLILTPVKLDFDWSKLEENDIIPEGMTIYAYQVETKKYKKYDIPSSYNGVVQLPVGKVQLIFVNNDNSNIYPDKDGSYLTNQLVLVNNRKILSAIYGGTSQHEIPLQSDVDTHITLTPACMCKHININIVNANTACQQAKSLKAQVTGLTNLLTICDKQAPEDAESITMSGKLTNDDSTLSGSFRCLDVKSDAHVHKLILAAYSPNGGIKAYRFYVTDEVKSQAMQHMIDLDIDFFDGEEIDQKDDDFPDVDKDGFNADIDDFDEEIIDADM